MLLIFLIMLIFFSIVFFSSFFFFFFFNDTATTEIYTLSLHDALPISIHEEGPEQTDPQALDLAGEREIKGRSEEHTSELQSRENLVCRLLLEKKKKKKKKTKKKIKKTKKNHITKQT